MKHNPASHPVSRAPANARFGTDPPHRILVIDEDTDFRVLYADVLACPNYHVDFAEDGAAGWKALRANPYNLLITEHDIPTLTGVELVRKLRAARMALPVVMASVRLPVFELVRSPSLRLAATLVKPFTVEALLDTVKRILIPAGPVHKTGNPMLHHVRSRTQNVTASASR